MLVTLSRSAWTLKATGDATMHGVPKEAVPEDRLVCLSRELLLERLPAYRLDNHLLI